MAVQPLNPSCPTLSPQDPSQADSGVVFKESCLWIVGPEEDVELSPQSHYCLGLPLGLSGKTKLLPLKPPSLHALPLKGKKKAKERETQNLEPNLNVCSPTHPASTCLHVVYMGLLFCSFLCSDRVSSFKVQLNVEEQAPFWVEPISANDSSLCVSTA